MEKMNNSGHLSAIFKFDSIVASNHIIAEDYNGCEWKLDNDGCRSREDYQKFWEVLIRR